MKIKIKKEQIKVDPVKTFYKKVIANDFRHNVSWIWVEWATKALQPIIFERFRFANLSLDDLQARQASACVMDSLLFSEIAIQSLGQFRISVDHDFRIDELNVFLQILDLL